MTQRWSKKDPEAQQKDPMGIKNRAGVPLAALRREDGAFPFPGFKGIPTSAAGPSPHGQRHPSPSPSPPFPPVESTEISFILLTVFPLLITPRCGCYEVETGLRNGPRTD